MKKIIIMSVICLASPLLQSYTFSAYGGGGGGSSISSSSFKFTTVLSKDTCPEGDRSGSMYDSTCGSAEEIVGTFTTQSVKKPIVAPIIKLPDRVEIRKAEIKKAGLEKPVNLPTKMYLTQQKIDTIMDTRTEMDATAKQKKLMKLILKINTHLEKKELSDTHRTIIGYVKDKALLMLDLNAQ